MTDSARRGRLMVGLILGLEGLLALGAFILMVVFARYEQLPRLILKTIVHVSLMCGLWCGVRWIKWLCVVGLVLVAGLCLYVPVRFPSTFSWAIMAPAAAPFAWGAWALIWSPSVAAFFRWQRGEIMPSADDQIEFILSRYERPASAGIEAR